MFSRARKSELRAAILRLSHMPSNRREAVLAQLDDEARRRAAALLERLRSNDGLIAASAIPDWLASRASDAGEEAFHIADAARDALRKRIAEIGVSPTSEPMPRRQSLADRMLGRL